MHIDTYKLKVTLITPLLGSQPALDVVTRYIAKRNGFGLPDDEAETLPDALDQVMTVFHRRDDDRIVLYDYHLKGFLKEAGRVLNRQVAGGVRNLRAKVASLVFVSPRQIVLHLPPGEDVDSLERPLRAQTVRGERVALTKSEMVPEDTWFECGLSVLPGEISEDVLRELLDYGFYQGLGQWRSGGWGRFSYELTREE